MRASSFSTVLPLFPALPEVRPLRLTLFTLELERTVLLEEAELERTALEALPLFWAEPERTALPLVLPEVVPELERTALELAEPERLEELLVDPERTALELEPEDVEEPVLRRTSCW